MDYYLAIDIGASSGRHIVGWRKNGKIQTKEGYRFPTGADTADDRLIWNTEKLFHEVKSGIRAAFSEFASIRSLSIDAWAVTSIQPSFPTQNATR